MTPRPRRPHRRPRGPKRQVPLPAPGGAGAVPPKAVPPKAVPAESPVPPAVPPKAVPPKAVPRKAVAAKASAPPAPPSPAADPLLGRTLGRCRLEELIGVGRTARVYRAHYEALDDTVAVKILRREVAANPVLVERFDSEARAIAKVDNENVLKIYDVGITDDGLHYMVVELLEGEEILDLIQREETVEPMDALRIVRQAANGLAAAHAHQLVHRDIKPQNLFLLEDGTVKVVDFGLAAGIDDTSERVGTPHYMAPEVCELAKAETASDIYGLGITLYHLLTGQPPYAGQDIKGILRSHMAGEPLHPERARPGLPRPVCDIVRLLTKRDPVVRPTAVQVVEELDRFGGEQLRQKDTLRKRRGRSRARSAVARRERKGRGTPALAAILGVLLAGGALVAIVAANSGSDLPSEPPPRSASLDAPGAQPGADPLVPARVEPVESPEAKKAREDEAKRRAEAKEGQDALERVEQWARENWHGPADTDGVIAKYRYVSDRWKGLPCAEEAKRRIKGIKDHKIHPHPDRQWTSADELAAVRSGWEASLPALEKHVAAFEYDEARKLVPEGVSDESGSLSRELDYWREHLGLLVAFQRMVAAEAPKLEPEERTLHTPDGDGVLQKATSTQLTVQVGTRTKTYTWAQIGAEALVPLAVALVSGKEADVLVRALAFTVAHRLKKAFWDIELELDFVAGAGPYERINKRYKEDAKSWGD